MNITNPINQSNTVRWTRSAIECLQNHCVCGRCPMIDIVYNCRMKSTVLELYRKYGKPEEYIEPTVREEE